MLHLGDKLDFEREALSWCYRKALLVRDQGSSWAAGPSSYPSGLRAVSVGGYKTPLLVTESGYVFGPGILNLSSPIRLPLPPSSYILPELRHSLVNLPLSLLSW